MTIAMQPIYTQTVGAGGAGLYFQNIPQTFTDLMISVSCRGQEASVTNQLFLRFNDVGASGSYSVTRVSGSGSAAFSDRANGTFGDFFYAGAFCPNASATANTFGSANFYIPNYRSSTNKSVIVDGVSENNATFSTQFLTAGLILNTNPIVSFSISAFGNLAQYSTVTLYGITKG